VQRNGHTGSKNPPRSSVPMRRGMSANCRSMGRFTASPRKRLATMNTLMTWPARRQAPSLSGRRRSPPPHHVDCITFCGRGLKSHGRNPRSRAFQSAGSRSWVYPWMRTADVAKVHNPRRRQLSGSPFLLHVTEFARKTRESCGCTFAGEQRTKAIAEKWPIQLLDCTRQRAVVFNDLPLCGLFAVALRRLPVEQRGRRQRVREECFKQAAAVSSAAAGWPGAGRKTRGRFASRSS
jgi:hypothetical protein